MAAALDEVFKMITRARVNAGPFGDVKQLNLPDDLYQSAYAEMRLPPYSNKEFGGDAPDREYRLWGIVMKRAA